MWTSGQKHPQSDQGRYSWSDHWHDILFAGSNKLHCIVSGTVWIFLSNGHLFFILSLKRKTVILLHTPVISFSFINLKIISRNVQNLCVYVGTFVHIRTYTHTLTTPIRMVTEQMGFKNIYFLVWSNLHRNSIVNW